MNIVQQKKKKRKREKSLLANFENYFRYTSSVYIHFYEIECNNRKKKNPISPFV